MYKARFKNVIFAQEVTILNIRKRMGLVDWLW